jgi:hypothetical protein
MPVKADVKNKYAAAYTGSGGQWIKTPTLVVSWIDQAETTNDKGNFLILEGGHRLAMEFPEFFADSSVAAGQITIERGKGRNIIRVNKKDAARLSAKSYSLTNQTTTDTDLDRLTNEIKQDIAQNGNIIPRKRIEVIASVSYSGTRGYARKKRRRQ